MDKSLKFTFILMKKGITSIPQTEGEVGFLISAHRCLSPYLPELVHKTQEVIEQHRLREAPWNKNSSTS